MNINNPRLQRCLKEQRLGVIPLECWLAGVPLLASLVIILANAVNNYSTHLLVLLLFVCSVTILIDRMKKGFRLGRLGSIVFVAGFVIWYSYPGFITFFLPGYQFDHDVYSFLDEETIVWVLVYLSLFLFSGVGVSHLFSHSKSVRPKHEDIRTKTNVKMVISLTLSGCSLGFLSYVFWGTEFSEIIYSIFQSRAIEKPWSHTMNLGDTISPFTFMASSFMIAGASLLWSVTLDKQVSIYGRILLGIVTLCITTILFFDRGTRSVFLLIVIPAVAIRLIRLWRGSRSRALVMILIATIIGIAILQFQVLYRSSFARPYLSEFLFENFFTLRGTIDFFKETLFAVTLVPAHHDYFRESTFIHFLVSPIPRFIWPGKPVSQLVWFYTLCRWDIDIYSQAGNALPGIVGQYYMSWGWLGPIMIGSALGWFTRRLDALLSKFEIQNDLYTNSLGMMLVVWIFISYRLLSPVFLYPVLISAIIVSLSRRVGRKRKSPYAVKRPCSFAGILTKSPSKFA